MGTGTDTVLKNPRPGFRPTQCEPLPTFLSTTIRLTLTTTSDLNNYASDLLLHNEKLSYDSKNHR